MAKQRVAMIGMGQMGSGMVGRLVECGYDVLGYDINPQTQARLKQQGLAMADSIAAAVSGRQVIMTSLPDPAAVRAAWLEDNGIAAHAAPKAALIELSTIDPGTMRDVAAHAAQRQLDIIDCPVSGSPAEARLGKLVLIAGGDRGVIEGIEPLLLCLGETWRYTGPVGTAKVVKIVNNMMSMGNVLVASEAFALGVAAGVDPANLYDVLSVSGGRSHHFTKRFPNALKGNFEPGFKMELGEKDLALGVELGRTTHVPTPVASMAREMFGLALLEGHRGKDIVSLLALYQHWASKGQ